jgi:hypothetical protein
VLLILKRSVPIAEVVEEVNHAWSPAVWHCNALFFAPNPYAPPAPEYKAIQRFAEVEPKFILHAGVVVPKPILPFKLIEIAVFHVILEVAGALA